MIPFKEITTTSSILSLKKYMHQAELVHLFIFPKGTYSFTWTIYKEHQPNLDGGQVVGNFRAMKSCASNLL